MVGDPFYDAAVRSMGLSWHNFFFGVFEPGGSVSIDKPPLDLWLQVASVKIFGYGSVSLKLPEALAGTIAVPLLYASVRRIFGVSAGLASALALAGLPIDVITARSDTMDGLMMTLIVLALLMTVRATEDGRTRWLLFAAVALGLAFNVKLLESVVALPGLGILAFLGMPGRPTRRAAQLALAGVLYVVVALSWLTATLLFPAHDRPYAIGSTNGSAWNAAFVFNGSNRISQPATEGSQPTYGQGRSYPTATQTERDHIPITAPSAKRLLVRIGPLSGERLGLEILAAVFLGGPALLAALGLATSRRRRGGVVRGDSDSDDGTRRIRGAAALGFGVWLIIGIVLFSRMARLHPRYVEGFTPAVAAVLGIGAAWATSQGIGATRTSRRARLAILALALVALVIYEEHLVFGVTATWGVALVGAVAAILAMAGAVWRSDHRSGRAPRDQIQRILLAVALVGTLVAILAVPFRASLNAISERVSDAGHVGVLAPGELQKISAYLLGHQGSARYEVAAASATAVGSLIVHDLRPVLVLTTYNARTLTSVARLRQLIAAGEVRYAWINTFCGPHTSRLDAACSAPALWIRAHGTDVSHQARLAHSRELWRLPGALA